jgi:hypothetical protein
MDTSDEIFRGLNIQDGGSQFNLGYEEDDEDNEESPVAHLQPSGTTRPQRTLDRHCRILYNPSSIEEFEDGLQIILEENLHRLPNETPECFNIRVKKAETKEEMYAQKLATIKRICEDRRKLTEKELADIERRMTEKEALLEAKMSRESQISPGTQSSYTRHQVHWRVY